MKKAFLFFSVALTISINVNAQAWAQLPDFPGAERDDGVAFVINNKAYCGTGLQVGWSLTKDFYSLNLTTETWTPVASMPSGEERQYACGFTDGTNGFVFGGESGGTDLNDLWMYSPTTNSWTAMAPKPGNGVRGASCFVIGNIAYFIGGAFTATDAINEVWAYDMAGNTWTQKNNLPFTNWRGCASSLNNLGYLLFGKDVGQHYNRYLYEYNPALDNWVYKSTFAGAFGETYAKMETINDQLVIFSGIDSLGNCTNDLWTYNVGSNAWQFISSLMTTTRKGGMGFSNGGTFYYSCGITPAPSNTRLKETWKTSYAIGIKEPVKAEYCLIYPNPASEFITLKIPKPNIRDDIYKVVNGKGEVVLTGTLPENHQIEVSQLRQGIYQLIIDDRTSRFIIQ
jgi:N-acetylneuraminic acid mutarotase